jgi:energy-coupling factor transporter ATP-binding protein EcfA2
MTPALEVKDLHFHYHDGKLALRGVSFSAQKGECLGVIGPNGAGKSTILLHLNGLLPEKFTDPSSVFVMGEPVTPATIYSIHRKVGLLFQDPDDQLFCPTVFEDVAFGPRQYGLSEAEVRGLVEESLHRVGLAGFEKRSPHHLSGGEKQRVCLAGVLACRPEILILDEPTSDLDPRGKRELKALLKTLTATKVIASHDLELVLELCSRTIVLDEGMIVADGPTAEILADEKFMLAHGLEKPHSLLHRHPH